jgi:hypothetical protein
VSGGEFPYGILVVFVFILCSIGISILGIVAKAKPSILCAKF